MYLQKQNIAYIVLLFCSNLIKLRFGQCLKLKSSDDLTTQHFKRTQRPG